MLWLPVRHLCCPSAPASPACHQATSLYCLSWRAGRSGARQFASSGTICLATKCTWRDVCWGTKKQHKFVPLLFAPLQAHECCSSGCGPWVLTFSTLLPNLVHYWNNVWWNYINCQDHPFASLTNWNHIFFSTFFQCFFSSPSFVGASIGLLTSSF